MIQQEIVSRKKLNYAIRRVIYDLMVASEAIALHKARTLKRFRSKSVLKIAAIMMARNIHDFLFEKPRSNTKGKRRHSDDVFYGDFQLTNWSPSKKAELSKKTKERIHKIAGHIVCNAPVHFEDFESVCDIVIPLVSEGCEFVRQTVDAGIIDIKENGNAEKYLKHLNTALRYLNLKGIYIT